MSLGSSRGRCMDRMAALLPGRSPWLLAVLVSLLLWHAPPASAGEGSIGKEVKAQIWTEEGLRWNKIYLTTINPFISNYGTDEEKLVFRRCVNHYLRTEILFLAYRFNEAYQEVRNTQRLLIQLYERMIAQGQRDVREGLQSYGRRVVFSRNVRARKYLALGMRDLEHARLKVLKERNMRPWLYLLKLNELSEALKLVRHANRYFVLLRLEFDSIYPASTEDLTYAKTRRLLASGFPQDRTTMVLMHDDNYFRVGEGRDNLWDRYRNEPDFAVLRQALPGWRVEDYKRYR